MRFWKALKAAWREFWRVWRDRPVNALPVLGIERPADVPDSGFTYIGYTDGKRECIADKRAKVLFLIARREGRVAQLWLNGNLRDWNPR